MKKIMTLALAAMVACASFAQSPLKATVKADKASKTVIKKSGLEKDAKAMRLEKAQAIQAAKAEKAAAQQSMQAAKAQKTTPVVSFFAKSSISAPANFVAPKGAAKAEGDLELVVPSAEVLAAADVWNVKGYNWYQQTSFTRTAVVAVVGNEIYMQGLAPDVVPEAWLKGTIAEDGTVTFPEFTYAGPYSDYETYFCNIQWTEEGTFAGFGELTGYYNAEEEVFTFTSNMALNTQLDGAAHFGSQAIAAGSYVTHAALPEEEAVTGAPVDVLPFSADFADSYNFYNCGILDANGDGNTWTWDVTNHAYYPYSSTSNADDYLVTPAIKLEAGKNYAVTANVRAYSSYYAERIEVVAGTAAKKSALTMSIIPPTDVLDEEATDLVAEFTVPETGYYHFAAHAISDADMFYLILNSLTVEYGTDPKAPDAIDDLEIIPGENGQKRAMINFTTPTKAIDGSTLSEELDVKIYHNGQLWQTIKSFPGIKKTIFDNGIENSGVTKFTLICDKGELHGKKVEATTFIGTDVPKAPELFTVAEAGDHLAFAWTESPEVGENGGYVDVENVYYQIWDVVDLIPGWGLYVLNSQLSDDIYGQTSYDLPYDCNAGAIGQYIFGILALNPEGECGAYPMVAAYLGAPYAIPVHESFEGGSVHYDWFIQGDAAISASLVEEGSVDDYAIELNADADEEIAALYTTKFSLAGSENAAVSADMYATSEGADVTLLVEVAGETTALETMALTDEWATYKWNVSAFANEPSVRFYIVASFPEAGSLLFDNFNVLDLYSDNLVAAISAPAKVVAGNTAAITVMVQNLGENVAEDYVVKVYADDELVDALGGDPIAFYQTETMTAYMSTSIFDEAKTVTLKAVVEYAPELKPVDNEDETTIALVAPTAGKVENLTATTTAEGVVLEWTVPEATVTEVVENFESYDEFAYVQNGEQLGDWTGWDLDGGQMYGWNGGAWPHTGETGAFGIYNPTAIGFTEIPELPSGLQTALIMAAVPGTSATGANDDWMVSPELPGVAQTISFMVSELTDQYGNEQFQVLVSTTGNTPDCFEVVYEGEASMNWEEVAVNLPEGAKYFAIRNISVDVFGLLIDDATFTVGAGKPTSFNVYVDQVKVGSTEENTYTVTGLAAGEHQLSVTAVYGVNESAPETVTVVADGDATAIKNIETSTADEIYTVNGVRVSKANKAGVYVVNGQKVIIK